MLGPCNVELQAFPHDLPLGCRVAALDEMVMRSDEHLKSEQVAAIDEGSTMEVLAYGSEPRRLQAHLSRHGFTVTDIITKKTCVTYDLCNIYNYMIQNKTYETLLLLLEN